MPLPPSGMTKQMSAPSPVPHWPSAVQHGVPNPVAGHIAGSQDPELPPDGGGGGKEPPVPVVPPVAKAPPELGSVLASTVPWE